MIIEKDFSEIPAFTIVRKRILAINPIVEFVKAALDNTPDTYLIRLQLTTPTTLRLSKELLDDLSGRDTSHREAQLDREIRNAIDRMK